MLLATGRRGWLRGVINITNDRSTSQPASRLSLLPIYSLVSAC